jgi:RsiW-degrading membrane proteinase PrsW (M82 family)
MNGLWIILLLIFIAALPVFLVYLWFRLSKFPFSLSWFLCSLLAGAIASFIALFLQTLFDVKAFFSIGDKVLALLLAETFIRIAAAEELSRLLVLFGLFRLFRRLGWKSPLHTRHTEPSGPPDVPAAGYGAATGLVTGLGFALIEGAFYGISDMGITLLRAFTTAPLHGACGSRIGTAAVSFMDRPLSSLFRIVSAIVIHGMYNLMIILPGIPPAIALLVAFSALISSLVFIQSEAGAGKKGVFYR